MRMGDSGRRPGVLSEQKMPYFLCGTRSLSAASPRSVTPFIVAVCAFAPLLLWASTAFGATWFVDKDAAGANTGTSWADAFTTIQPAIDAASADAGGEVWVAEGVYDEARTSPNADGSGEDSRSVVMKANFHPYSGFVGTKGEA